MDTQETRFSDPSYGLAWSSKSIFGSQPIWTKEPDIGSLERLARRSLGLSPNEPSEIRPLAQGAFNKLYIVNFSSLPACNDHRKIVLRVTLPVDPAHKTSSEVATLAFVRRFSNLVPRVHAWSTDRDEIGFEWMITECKPGKPLSDFWASISRDAAGRLIDQVVDLLATLFEQRFEGIGNLFFSAPQTEDVRLGQIVSMAFFWDGRLRYPIERGPFRSSHDWLLALLDIHMRDADCCAANATDDEELDDANRAQIALGRLRALLPTIVPPLSPNARPEPSALYHADLSWHNILVDHAGVLRGIVDWECVSAVPLWYACQLPAFLWGRDRPECPSADKYARDEVTGALGEVYFEHLREHIQTWMRTMFLEAMEMRSPEWIEEYQAAGLKTDLELAISSCDEFGIKRVEQWVDQVEVAGANAPSLRQALIV